MNHYTKEDILEMIEEEDIAFVRLQFTDVYGNFKNVAITARQAERALDGKVMFDGASIDGFAAVEDSDMYLRPDFDTFEIIPWRPQQGKVARLICDVYKPDGTAYESDPRHILKNVLAEAAELGYEFEVGPELEFFLFHTDEDGLPTTVTHETASYFDIGPRDLGENARRDIVLTLDDMDIEIEASHHEGAPAQHEVDMKYGKALTIADNIMTAKMVIKTIAKRHGLHATFMPKPKYGVNGSGMHLNLSLSRDGVNIFTDRKDENHLSEEAYYFIGGLMKHMKAITFIANPIVNSYKRFVTGFEAPIYLAWSVKNRTPLVRIPLATFGHERVELRSPDPSCNPYLTMAVCLAAGLDGIKNKIVPPDPVNKNIYNLTRKERQERGIESLPESLWKAAEEFEKDELIQSVLGEDLAEKYLLEKKKEFGEYFYQVTSWEIDRYLHRY
ncbi:MAG: glutamine synthetase family protein [Dorea sp.]|nr:glutamine synthetase family protein [Dorea sp.]